MVEIALVEPASIIAGDTVKWRRRFADYAPGDGWALSYVFVAAAGQFTASGVDNSDGTHLVTLAASDTEAYAPGVYRWHARVTLGVERFTVDHGSICVEPNFGSIGAADTRSWAQTVLDAVEATIAGRATTDQQSYAVGGRSVSRMTMAELLDARDRLKRVIAREQQAERIARGKRSLGIVRVRA